MNSRPNVLFLMSDQHNAGSLGCAGHSTVRTPNLDRIAASGVRFTRAYCNNPICAPSRVSFATGQYPHTHGILGNNNFELDDRNPDTLAAVFRRRGYQTAIIGKAHMVKRWDAEAYEHIRYCDLCDADRVASEGGAEIDFASVETDSATASDADGAIVKRVIGLRWWLVDPSRGCIDITGVGAAEGLVGTLVVVNPGELDKPFLLLQQVERGGLGGLFLEG